MNKQKKKLQITYRKYYSTPCRIRYFCNKDGVLNGAPYSYFNIVAANPPLISVSVQRKAGERKDTSRNAIEKGEFVVHISDESYVAAINETAANLPPNESEIELAKLTPIESDVISVPGVKEANIRMECVLERAIPLAEQKTHQLATY